MEVIFMESTKDKSTETVGEVIRWINQQYMDATKDTPPNRDYMETMQRLCDHVESALDMYRKSFPNAKVSDENQKLKREDGVGIEV